MLQLKVFDPRSSSDIKRMNEFLKTHIRPQDGDILIVGDRLVVSYEDGTGPSLSQKIFFKEQMKTKEEYKLRDYNHTIRLAEVKIDGVENQILSQKQILKDANDKKASLFPSGKSSKDQYDDLKDLELAIKMTEAEIKRLGIVIENEEEIIKRQKAQITDSMIVLAVIDEEIRNLEQEL